MPVADLVLKQYFLLQLSVSCRTFKMGKNFCIFLTILSMILPPCSTSTRSGDRKAWISRVENIYFRLFDCHFRLLQTPPLSRSMDILCYHNPFGVVIPSWAQWLWSKSDHSPRRRRCLLNGRRGSPAWLNLKNSNFFMPSNNNLASQVNCWVKWESWNISHDFPFYPVITTSSSRNYWGTNLGNFFLSGDSVSLNQTWTVSFIIEDVF